MADEEVAQLRGQSEQELRQARVVGVIAIILVVGASVGLGLCFACLVSEPLRRLSGLMQQLGDFDFEKDSAELAALRSGRHACIKNVNELQIAFCRLLGGVEAFARFVPKTVVTRIVGGDRRTTRLHVDKREVTTMFSTIAGFARLSELLSEHDLARVLTAFHTVMTEVVERHRGAVAEILDAGLLVYWNAPDEVPGHADKACKAALAQQLALRTLNEELAEEGLPQLAMHIGLHTGWVLSGNIGSFKKMKFGCMGDSVNLASRLNGLCKYYSVGTVCSGATYAALHDSAICCRQLDLVQVKGRQKPTMIYELVGQVDSGRDADLPQESYVGTGSNEDHSTAHRGGKPLLRPSSISPVTAVPSDPTAARTLSNGTSASTTAIGVGPALTASSGTAAGARGLCHWELVYGMDDSIDEQDAQSLDGDVAMSSSYPVQEARAPPSARLDRGRRALTALPSLLRRGPSCKLPAKGTSTPAAMTVGRSSLSEPDVEAMRRGLRSPAPTAVTPRHYAQVRRYEEALRHFQQAHFDEAMRGLHDVLEERPNDVAAQLLLQRASRLGSRRLSQEELAAWTGVNSMTEK